MRVTFKGNTYVVNSWDDIMELYVWAVISPYAKVR
jgi:hypothetical protein